MARIITLEGACPRLLTARQLIGRSRTCQLRVETPETSSEHALLRWQSGTWELQDLHSRNGTYVEGRLLTSGRRLGLEEGARIGFGRPDEYVLANAGPPSPHAVGLRPRQPTVELRAGLLVFPCPEHPEAIVLCRDHMWWLERDDCCHPIADGEIVVTGSGSWRVHLPEPLPATRDAEGGPPALAAFREARLACEEARRRYVRLSPQEERVCRLVAAGLLNKQIASELVLAEQTVRLYRSNALKKLEVTGVAELVRLLARVDTDG